MLRRRGGVMSSSGGGGIVEAATAPTGVAGLVWRNEGVHRVYLGGTWLDLLYYDGDKAPVCINMDTLPIAKAQYVADDYLSISHTSYLPNYVGNLNHPLQKGGYVEIVLETPSASSNSCYFGFYSDSSLSTYKTAGAVLYDTYSSKIYYGDSLSVSYGTRPAAALSLTMGVSRGEDDAVHFYVNGVARGLVAPAAIDTLNGWFPTILGMDSASVCPYSYTWHVDESTILYLPDGYRPINEQS